MPAENLKSKTLKGVGWSATENLLSQGISFLIGLILARLLSPAEYGTIGLAMVVIVILSSFIDSGFSSALIRKVDATEEDYGTMFVTNLVVSVGMYVILFFTAPLVSQFLEADITALIRVLGIGMVITATTIVQHTNLSKKVDFKTKTKATFVSVVVGGTAGIVGAFCGLGVWALALQQLLSNATQALMIWRLNPWKPCLRFSKESFQYLWGFGYKMLLSGLLDHAWRQIYVIIVGKVYSPAVLGQYSRAKHYAEFFSKNINGVVSKISYPTLSNLQNEPERMVSIYRRIIKVMMFVVSISMFSLGAVSEPLIYCLIGEKWHEAATYLPYMCLTMSLYPLHSVNLSMLMVQGRSDIFLYLEIIKKVIALLPIGLGIYVGVKAMLIGSIFVGVIAYFLNSYYTGKKLHYSSWMQIKDIASSYAIAIVIALSVYFFKFLPISYFIILPIQIVVGAAVFFTICELFKPEEYIEIKTIATDAIHKYIRK